MTAGRRFQAPGERSPAASVGPQPHILVATLLRPTGETGVQTHFNGFLRFLEGRGLAGRCVTPFSAPRALVLPVFGLRRVVDRVSGAASVWWYRRWHEVFLRVALARALRSPGPAVVYAQCPVSALAALRARRRRDQQVFVVVHFNVSQADEWAEKGAIAHGGRLFRRIRAFEEAVLPRVDGIVYVSEFMRRELESRIPSLRGVRSSVIPNFVTVSGAGGASKDVSGDLVSVGTLEPRKNQAYALEVVGAAAAHGHRLTLTVIGDGPDRRALENLADRLGVADQVRFLGFRSDATALIRGHRFFCHSARRENFPLAILEAMAEGVPVVAAPVGGIPEIVRPGVEGLFWPLDDPEEGARVVIRHMDDDPLRERMSAACRRRFEECYTADVVCPKLLDFLSPARAA